MRRPISCHHFSEQMTTLYRNYGGGFADASVRAGLGVNRKYVGFGVDFFDADNDGWKDIFIANGHVYSQLADGKLHLTYRQPKVLYRNLGNGRFQDVSLSSGRGNSRRQRRSRLRRSAISTTTAMSCAGEHPRRAADAAAQRRREPAELDHDQVPGHALQPLRDRTRSGPQCATSADGRGEERSSYYSRADFRLQFGLGPVARQTPLNWRGLPA